MSVFVNNRTIVFLLNGPIGSGKTWVCEQIQNEFPRVLVTSSTKYAWAYCGAKFGESDYAQFKNKTYDTPDGRKLGRDLLIETLKKRTGGTDPGYAEEHMMQFWDAVWSHNIPNVVLCDNVGTAGEGQALCMKLTQSFGIQRIFGAIIDPRIDGGVVADEPRRRIIGVNELPVPALIRSHSSSLYDMLAIIIRAEHGVRYKNV